MHPSEIEVGVALDNYRHAVCRKAFIQSVGSEVDAEVICGVIVSGIDHGPPITNGVADNDAP